LIWYGGAKRIEKNLGKTTARRLKKEGKGDPWGHIFCSERQIEKEESIKERVVLRGTSVCIFFNEEETTITKKFVSQSAIQKLRTVSL